MKKFMFVLIFSSLFITISSCTKNSENYYSCDPTINEWVINNSERIQKLTPSELMEYNLESQKAIFCSMTPQQRFEVWRYKFDSVLTLTWSQSEMNHITNLGDTINADWFNDEELSDTLFKAQIEDLIHTWVEYSHDSLNFSYGIIFSIICRIDIPQVNGVLLPTDSLDYTTNQLKDSGGGGTGGCKCNTSDDWCDLVGDFGECRSILQSCKPTRWGCGTLWLDPCNGMCVLTGPGGIE